MREDEAHWLHFRQYVKIFEVHGTKDTADAINGFLRDNPDKRIATTIPITVDQIGGGVQPGLFMIFEGKKP